MIRIRKGKEDIPIIKQLIRILVSIIASMTISNIIEVAIGKVCILILRDGMALAHSYSKTRSHLLLLDDTLPLSTRCHHGEDFLIIVAIGRVGKGIGLALGAWSGLVAAGRVGGVLGRSLGGSGGVGGSAVCGSVVLRFLADLLVVLAVSMCVSLVSGRE
jgi:hypothetical protein